MYKAGLVAVVVADGKIVREMNSGGTSTVYLPFGCEYSIRFKNNENRRAAVTVSVDGKDAMSGHQLVVDANSESEIKGFMEASGGIAKNAFRFIEKTDRIREHRGDKIDDGIIRIEFQYEIPRPVYTPLPHFYAQDNLRRLKSSNRGLSPSSGEISFSDDAAGGIKGQCFNSVTRGVDLPQNDSGITVAGSHVNQKFGTTHLNTLDPTKHVIVFELRGAKLDGHPIVQPVLTRTKVECPTCGKACKSSAKYCSECSTCLV